MAGIDHVRWFRRPTLQAPVLVAAFEGWNDAGEAASTAARHLRDAWDLDLVAELDPEEFFSFTDTRPLVTLDDDGRRRIEWPATRFWAGAVPGGDRDVVVLEGIEPNLRWRTFGEAVTAVAAELDVELVVTMGALLTDIPHTRPTTVIGTADDPEMAERLDLKAPSYEGPTGIVGALHQACRDDDLDALSLWGSVPSYVPGSASPKAALALVERLARLLGGTVPVTELEIATADYVRQLDELVAEDAESADYVAELERAFDAAALEDRAIEQDGNALVAEVERFLRER